MVTGAGTAQATTPRAGSARGPVVAYVQDHRLAEIRLLVDEREVVIQDRDLVNRILNAAGGH